MLANTTNSVDVSALASQAASALTPKTDISWPHSNVCFVLAEDITPTVRRWLGQKILAMAIHYSETADTSKQMRGVLKKFDPLGSKTRT